jgi:hypothetical protein
MYVMAWFKTRFTSSFFALFASSQSSLIADAHPVDIDDIREAMLILLAGIPNPQVERRITYAGDLDGLWYLRGELMGALAPVMGESAALEKILHVTAMFQVANPQRFKSRLGSSNGPRRGVSQGPSRPGASSSPT